MRRLIVLAALALAACGGPDTDPSASRPDADVASNFGQPIDAKGIDPSWALKIRGQQLTLERPGQPTLVATAPGAVIQPHTAAWSATLPDGATMKVSLYASPCFDRLTGVTSSFSAEVALPAASPLTGCADPPSRR